MINKIFPVNSKRREIAKKLLVPRKIPRHLSKNFIQIDESSIEQIKLSLQQNYFARESEEYFLSDAGQKDLRDHLIGRLEKNRNFIIPWLDSNKSLKGSSILEIGCGTGCSTVALAEQGAKVVAVDIDREALVTAKDRCKIYSLEVDFFEINATEVHKIFSSQHFDFIIFYAALEHMIHEERMVAMSNTWRMLSPGDLWCVIGTPNRLWHSDSHTSLLPFYLWLPDDLAFKYSRFSPRKSFNKRYREYNEDSRIHFLRRGRGVSFHEFELTMDRIEQLDVVSSMSIYLRKLYFARWLKWKFSFQYRYTILLSKICRKVHRGFYEPKLDLVIRK